MEENTNNLRENVEELYKQSKFEEITALLTDEELEIRKDAELYVLRGKTWNIKESTLLEGGFRIAPIRGGIRAFVVLMIVLNILDNSYMS